MQLSEQEWKIMRVVWERSPASARDVLEQLEEETGWAYTTVKTMMSRLVEKGALSARIRANTSLYEPLITEDLAQGSALRALVDRAFDGTFGNLMAHLLEKEKLSKRDRKALGQLLEESEN